MWYWFTPLRKNKGICQQAQMMPTTRLVRTNAVKLSKSFKYNTWQLDGEAGASRVGLVLAGSAMFSGWFTRQGRLHPGTASRNQERRLPGGILGRFARLAQISP